MDSLKEVMGLLDCSYSVFHVVRNMKEKLLEAGFEELDERKEYSLKPGKKYFVTRNGSSILAFRLPEKTNYVFQLTATHNDSPSFKLKPNPVLVKNHLMMLDCEPYGGGIYNTWLDRPLSLAGRVMVEEEGKITTKLLAIDEDLLVIPNVAIHMNREVNNGYKYNPAVDLLPLFGEEKKDFDFNSYLLEKLGMKEGKVLSFDLFLYNRQKATLTGANKEFLASPRLDDLSSAYSSLLGFLAAEPSQNIQIFVSFDNEEVGSLTKQGAHSTFLKDNLRRIVFALGGTEENYLQAVSSGMLVSIDNAHANHPNHPEYSDPSTDVRLNSGLVIKYNANQSYTSDSFSSAVVKSLCEKNSLPYQEFTNRADLRGGSTLGNLSNAEVSFTSVDIGIPQLAMHSSEELLGASDIENMVQFVKAYFNASIKLTEEGINF